eukprot:scaffold51445_cov38-Cyclotella_meneghiniana.AAC.6
MWLSGVSPIAGCSMCSRHSRWTVLEGGSFGWYGRCRKTRRFHSSDLACLAVRRDSGEVWRYFLALATAFWKIGNSVSGEEKLDDKGEGRIFGGDR